jgi:PAS domain S-box-containing protein
MIEYVNDKFVKISKYPREELVHKTHRVINSEYHSKAFFAQMWETILSGKIWQGEIRNRAKDGSHYWVNTTITPLLDEQGKPKKFIAIRHDITKRKELEQQKDEFISIATHELKTPVTSLKGYVQVLHRNFMRIGDHTSASYMAKMETQINKLSSLINDILDGTKIEAGKLKFYKEHFDMNALVAEVVEALQLTTERHQLIVSGKIKHTVFGDRERVGQVITNILSNAIKYSPQSDKINIKLSSTKTEAKVSVQDFGVGISKEKQHQVFERFYRVSGFKENTYPGLGLGLYISSELIKRHNGHIGVESEKGKGSTFFFTLPYINNGRSKYVES